MQIYFFQALCIPEISKTCTSKATFAINNTFSSQLSVYLVTLVGKYGLRQPIMGS